MALELILYDRIWYLLESIGKFRPFLPGLSA